MDSSKNDLDLIRAMVTDLSDLAFQAEGNQSNPDWEDRVQFVEDYNVAFPIANLIVLGFVDFNSLPTKSLDEIKNTWIEANEEGFFSTDEYSE